MKRNPEIIRI